MDSGCSFGFLHDITCWDFGVPYQLRKWNSRFWLGHVNSWIAWDLTIREITLFLSMMVLLWERAEMTKQASSPHRGSLAVCDLPPLLHPQIYYLHSALQSLFLSQGSAEEGGFPIWGWPSDWELYPVLPTWVSWSSMVVKGIAFCCDAKGVSMQSASNALCPLSKAAGRQRQLMCASEQCKCTHVPVLTASSECPARGGWIRVVQICNFGVILGQESSLLEGERKELESSPCSPQHC